MFGLAWREFRRRPGSLIGAAVMAAIGAALITAFLVMHTSIGSSRAPADRYAGTDVVAVGNAGLFTGEMVSDIAALPGVEQVVPELTFPVTLRDSSGSPVVAQQDVAQFGHAWDSASLTPMLLVEGTAPAGADQVVLDRELADRAGVRTGSAARIDVGGTVGDFTVSGVAESGHGPMRQHGVYFATERAAELAGRGNGRVDAVGVTASPGAEPAAVASAVQGYVGAALAGNVETPSGVPVFQVAAGADRGELEGVTGDHRATASAMNMLVWIVAAMAVVVIAGALVSSVRRRAAQVALLRGIGATPKQVLLLCQSEALLVSCVAILVGLPAGVLLAWGLLTLMRTLGAMSSVLTLHVDAVSLVTAAVVTLVVSQFAAWRSSRTALAMRPGDVTGTQSAGDPRTHRRRAWARVALGVGALLAAGAVQGLGMVGALPTAVMGSYGLMASLLIIVGVALLGSSLVHVVAVWLRRPVAASSRVSGYLGAANVGHHHRRYAGTTVPMTVGIALAGWALVGMPLFALANANQFADRVEADTTVVSTPLVREEHTGLAEPAREAIARTNGVDAAAGTWEGWVAALPDGVNPTARDLTWGVVAAGPISQELALGQVEGDLAAVEAGEGIALGRTYAQEYGAGLGDEVQVRLPGASEVTTLPVRAVFEQDRGGDNGVVVAQQALSGAVGSRWYDYVFASGSATPQSVAAVVAPDTVTVDRHDGVVEAYMEGREAAVDPSGTVGVVLVGVFLVVASINALVVAHTDRFTEFSALRRLSLTPREIRSMTAWEMLLTVVPACALGLAAVLWMAFSMAGADLSAALWAYPATSLLSICVLALVATIAATVLVVRGVQQRIVRQDRGAQ